MTSKTMAESTLGYRNAQEGGAARRARVTLVLLALVCILPVAASYLMYYFWQPTGTVNHGELLAPAPLPPAVLEGLAGQPPFPRSELDGRWTLVAAAPARCDRACAEALYTMRQSRLAQGKEMHRVARLWMVTDDAAPAAATLAAHEGLRVARAAPAWLATLSDAERGGATWLVDPLGKVMMRYPAGADPKGVIKDLQRLLKYSPLGRPQ